MCISCILTALLLMAIAAFLGYMIGRSLTKTKTVTQTIHSTSTDDSKLQLTVKELESLKTEHGSLRTNYEKLQADFTALQAAKAAPAVSVPKGPSRKEKQEAELAKIRGMAGQLDLGRIGSGSIADKDNLKRLPGLGAFAEKKLNAVGIYKFNQIAKLTEDDQSKLNTMLDLPKDKMQKAGWVLESKRILGLISEEEIVLDRVRGRRDWINWNRLGLGSMDDKDDLQKINGIGPFIEDKLNTLGIYKFSQLSKMTARDVALVNDAIELLDGHIERDDWVGQAKKFVKQKA